MTIPKILHFTWKSRKLPFQLARILKRWQKLHPDWDIRFYDDDDIRDFVAEHYPEQLAVFDGYPQQIMRADAFRFFVLHHAGGVYSDLDVVPQRSINELITRSACFVGAMPEGSSIRGERNWHGFPYFLCNAFMGSEPGHPFWERCIAGLEKSRHNKVLWAAGPWFLNGVGLTEEKAIRPDVLLPNYWSPLNTVRRPQETRPEFADRIAQQFTVIGRDEPALVSHLWNSSWAVSAVYRGPLPWQIPSRVKWALRRKRHPELAQLETEVAPKPVYDDQELSACTDRPRIACVIDLEGVERQDALADVIEGLSYPAGQLDMVLVGGKAKVVQALEARWRARFASLTLVPGQEQAAARRNAAVAHVQDACAFVLFVSGRMVQAPADSIEQLLSARQAVVSALVQDEAGTPQDADTFLYLTAGLFKFLYKQGGRDGEIPSMAMSKRIGLSSYSAYNIAPMTCVGSDCLLVDRNVFRAGVRFAETPYKLHGDSEGFSLMARNKGFEVCGLPNLKVVIAGQG